MVFGIDVWVLECCDVFEFVVVLNFVLFFCRWFIGLFVCDIGGCCFGIVCIDYGF